MTWATTSAIALVFSPDPWVELLHRFVADHGGARVRQLVVDRPVLDDEEFDVLVTGDGGRPCRPRWWRQLPRVVSRSWVCSTRGARREGSPPRGRCRRRRGGRRRAREEIVGVVGEQTDRRAGSATAGSPAPTSLLPENGASPVVLVAGAPGSGVTEEVGLALGVDLAGRSSTLLLDARLDGAGTSVRLGLPLSPNLRGAVDELLCGGDPAGSVLTLARSGLHVLTGFPNAASAGQVTVREVLDVVAALRPSFARLVLLADSEVRVALAADSDMVVVVAPTPLGVARTTSLLADLPPRTRAARHVVVNRAPRDRFRVGELRAAFGALDDVASVHVLPDDSHVGDAAWDGVVVGDGPFVRSVAVVAALLAGESGRRRPRAKREHRSLERRARAPRVDGGRV
ncbi:MAG: hypothetical protein U0W40_20600 [Acidimicrobiia bacterium]